MNDENERPNCWCCLLVATIITAAIMAAIWGALTLTSWVFP